MYNRDLAALFRCKPNSMDETIIDELNDIAARIRNEQPVGQRSLPVIERAVEAFEALRSMAHPPATVAPTLEPPDDNAQSGPHEEVSGGESSWEAYGFSDSERDAWERNLVPTAEEARGWADIGIGPDTAESLKRRFPDLTPAQAAPHLRYARNQWDRRRDLDLAGTLEAIHNEQGNTPQESSR